MSWEIMHVTVQRNDLSPRTWRTCGLSSSHERGARGGFQPTIYRFLIERVGGIACCLVRIGDHERTRIRDPIDQELLREPVARRVSHAIAGTRQRLAQPIV